MSTIIVPDLTARARARIGRTYQVSALARRYLTADLNRYQPLRTAWAHGFWPGKDNRFGKWHPADAPLVDYLQGLPPETCQQEYQRLLARRAELERLGYVFSRPVPNACELPPEPPGAPPRFPAPPRPPRPPVPPKPPKPPTVPTSERYKILDTGGIESFAMSAKLTAAPSLLRRDDSQALAVPLWATSLTLQYVPSDAGDQNASFQIPELGFQWDGDHYDSSQARADGPITVRLDFLALRGITMQGSMEGRGAAFVDQSSLHVYLAYRDVSCATCPGAPTPPESGGGGPTPPEDEGGGEIIITPVEPPPDWWYPIPV